MKFNASKQNKQLILNFKLILKQLDGHLVFCMEVKICAHLDAGHRLRTSLLVSQNTHKTGVSLSVECTSFTSATNFIKPDESETFPVAKLINAAQLCCNN